MSPVLDLIPYALPLVGVWLGAWMNRTAQVRLADRQVTTQRATQRREERLRVYAELVVATNKQVPAIVRWHVARAENASDAPTLERQMYDAMTAERAVRATVELVGSEPVRDAAHELAEAMVEGMSEDADTSFLERVSRNQTVLMLCMREDLGNEGSLRRKVGTNPPA